KEFEFNFLGGLKMREWIYLRYVILPLLLAIYLTILIFLQIPHFTSYVSLNPLFILILIFLNPLRIYIPPFLTLHTLYLLNPPLKILKHLFLIIHLKPLLFLILILLIQPTLIFFLKPLTFYQSSLN
uniref:DUF1361 domain-containing protein n=1 Tax=Staphylococcus epidermidis TaxID=1282 RepID=UPI0037D9AD98